MKKIVCSIAIIVALMFTANNASAQSTNKYGVFDFEVMVQAMPTYGIVDSIVKKYEVDSLGAERDFLISEFKRLDSTYKKDSTDNKPKNVLDMIAQQRGQVYFQLAYWQQISQNKSEQKRGQLSQPLFEAIAKSYNKILQQKKYELVLKPAAVELVGSGSKVDNIFALVAKDLKIPLPEELGGNQQQQAQAEEAPSKSPAKQQPAKQPVKTGGAKPTAKPKG
jgi:Skp family chaperone for outer membrane proteins